METRKGKLIVNKTGSGSSTFRATIPNKWVRNLGLNESIRNLNISFDGTQIIIKNNKEMNDMELNKLENKYVKMIEMLEELGKVNIDHIENLNLTIKELKLLDYEVYIEEGYLKLDVDDVDVIIEDTKKKIEEIIRNEDIITIDQLDEIELIADVYVESGGQSGTGEGNLYVAYLNNEDGNKTDIELAELVVER